MDKTLSFTEHKTKCAWKPAIAYDHAIGHIRKYFPVDGLKMLMNSLMIFRFHYSNGLLYNIPKYQREKLQRIQNIACSSNDNRSSLAVLTISHLF